MDIKDILGEIKPPERVYQLCVRPDLRAEWEQAEAELARVNAEAADSLASTSSAAKAAARRVRDLEDQMAAATVPLRLRALPYRELRALYEAHPPREDKDETSWNGDTFPVALLAACAIDPTMTFEQADQLVDRLTNGQWEDLFGLCWAMNKSTDDVPKSHAASALLRTSKKK